MDSVICMFGGVLGDSGMELFGSMFIGYDTIKNDDVTIGD